VALVLILNLAQPPLYVRLAISRCSRQTKCFWIASGCPGASVIMTEVPPLVDDPAKCDREQYGPVALGVTSGCS